VHDSAASANAKDCRILYARVLDEEGKVIDSVSPLQNIILEMQVEMLNDNVRCYFGFAMMKDLDMVMSSYLATERPEVENGPFRQGEIITVQVRLQAMAMRMGAFHLLGGVADESGLLWYETKLSKEVKITANKGEGSFVMASSWSVKHN
jgi:hypothetical protein